MCRPTSMVVLFCLFCTWANLQYANGFRPTVRKLPANETRAFEVESHQEPDVHTSVMDTDGKYRLSWSYDNHTITFHATVEARGWIALGFSPHGGMIKADIVLIYFDSRGIPKVSDRHSKKNGFPKKDSKQDYMLLAASKNETHIVASFRRLRDTCDDEQDYRLTSDNTRIIYAFSNRSVTEDEDNDDVHFDKHAQSDRGTKGVFLFEPPEARVQLPTDTITMDFRANHVRIPHDYHLTYWCQIFELPKLPLHHMIRLEPIVHKGNEKFVHHLAIYQCTGDMSALVNASERCFLGDGSNMSPMYQCATKALWFWNVGMNPTDMPEGVGYPMFENPKEDGFLLLESHFENPDLVPDVIDTSGIRMFLTPTPRPIEAGVMVMAGFEQAPFHILPPGESHFRFFVHGDRCLEYLPESGVNLFNALLHAHTRATSVRLHHYRDGVQLPDVSSDDNYNFFYQNFRQLEPPRRVYPNDELVVECVYDTSKDNKTVFGGFSTRDEMCASTSFYYPRAARGFMCFSYPDPREYAPIFGGELDADNMTVVLPSNQNVSLFEFVRDHLNWNEPGVRQRYTAFLINGQYVERLHIDLLDKPPPNLSKNESGMHLLTRKGYPRVTKPWIPEHPGRECPRDTAKVKTETSQLVDPKEANHGTPRSISVVITLIAFLISFLRSSYGTV